MIYLILAAAFMAAAHCAKDCAVHEVDLALVGGNF